jgi:hypothetical protein
MATPLKWPVKLALTVFLMPFLVGGILLGGSVASWLTGGHASVWLWLLLPCLALVGILLGGLVAYGIIVFSLACISQTHPLLAESEETPGAIARFLRPAFRLVKAFALWLAPRRA